MPAVPLAATAEPLLKPNQPAQRNEAPINGQHDVVRCEVFASASRSFSERDSGYQRGNAGIDVDDFTAGEIEDAGVAQEATTLHSIAGG